MNKKFYYILLIMFLLIFVNNSFVYATITSLPLRKGMSGPDVKELQQILVEMGFDLTVDGIFGLETEKVVKDFQLSQGLLADGVVGLETFDKLREVSENIEYEVQPGDTLSEIAEEFNVTIADIKALNQIKDDLIYVGQTLIIPRRGIGDGPQEQVYKNTIHVVQPGDALIKIAKRYGISVDTIKNANNLKSDLIQIGQRLVIPYLQVGPSKNFRLEKGAFIWPVNGRISSGYGYRVHPVFKNKHFHGGIDIAVKIGTPVLAAAGGKVIRAGWISGFGKTIILDHGNGVSTLYAHNSQLLVRVGDMVHVGQVIAKSGNTGQSTGPHLDFRIMLNEKPVNPLHYLP
ncbi:hypothetical protein BBF96_05150 [Anoxybacter fermentans]|uniref:LysM domain-containing protein n=1 Tax=Anoxybacter fermentans TaxID=1323375 RepID=A0A3S9SWZ9_9FIRM|nr:peptidoglycan DD-metalloendopeptidase family protein [Anoxybacter fermentans]AZR72829.1 hypothetical protein BBF96_05150 [Anoxybacter fermentans]